MDPAFLTYRLSKQIRQRRLNLGMTQADLANLADLTRQKVIAVEKGSLSVGMYAYAKVLGALDCELKVLPAMLPTLDEVHDLFD
ncbi:helix-turn-helix transcriptional regulator [Pseudomonas putida]|uniref:HTH cro/C1-type domain-containing protein n=1 Tax=Pseudomonas putida TaxID=303 RepID=A0A1Q9R1I0_PSEPU|nr:helix-turn-helix domain-containing protein [Pseudomonas putida]OLS61225.1 hypothetical protein PSEMO_42060 [Pseudomonas putida]